MSLLREIRQGAQLAWESYTPTERLLIAAAAAVLVAVVLYP